MTANIFSDWQAKHTQLWGKQPLRLHHTLHDCDLFSLGALADLIDAYPRQHYSLMKVGDRNADKIWLESGGERLKGSDVIREIREGRLWLNLRRANDVDTRYAALLDRMFDEIGGHVADQDGFPERSLGILISSPDAQVYYHADLPNQSLWQVSGRKRVFVYPSAEPFISGEDLERISLFEVEVDMPYATWYDEHAVVFDLEPGEMLHWPLNAPHRVENLGDLSVSITTEYWSKACSRKYRLNMANGAMRRIFGISPDSDRTTGAGFFAKSVLWSAIYRTGWLDKVRAERKASTAERRVDPGDATSRLAT